MDPRLWAILIGALTGAIGYWITTFWMQPLLRYQSIRNQILIDFIYYAQVVNANGLNEEMQQLYRERILANRKTSAQLFAAALNLPRWYLWYLQRRGINPAIAASHLIAYSNTTEYGLAHQMEQSIRKYLGLPTKD